MLFDIRGIHFAGDTILPEGSHEATTCFACLAVLLIGATAAWMQAPQAQPQPKPYKVVFDLTSSDPLDERAVLRWIKEVSGVNPRNEMEVVMYGRGLDLVVSGKSTMRPISQGHEDRECEV